MKEGLGDVAEGTWQKCLCPTLRTPSRTVERGLWLPGPGLKPSTSWYSTVPTVKEALGDVAEGT